MKTKKVSGKIYVKVSTQEPKTTVVKCGGGSLCNSGNC